MPPKPKGKDGSAIRIDSALTGIDRWIWPEWSEADISAEKWESGGGTTGGKKPEKGKSATPSYFEDPDGQPVLPRSLAEKCRQWRRIPDIYLKGGATTVFEELTPHNPISILQSNTHLLYSPYIRYLIGSIKSLQSFCLSTDGLEEWRPWSLIYSLNKPGGKEHKPLVNPSGKYICKLFWCGKWRKIVVDDAIPCDEDGTPLLIVSDNLNEIWPLIISKALLKLSALSLSTRSPEIPEWHIITGLTSWMPEYFTDNVKVTWDLLTNHLPSWCRSSGPPATPQVDAKKDKKSTKKKDDAPNLASDGTYPLFCLANIELQSGCDSDTDTSHPAWIIKTRDKPLKEPSPPPEIPKWKLVRPQAEVLQLLDDIEKAKIPHRWCQVRSPLKISEDMSEDTTTNPEGQGEGADEAEAETYSPDGSEWIRIDDLADKPKKIVIFHRQTNPNYYHQHEYLPAIKENIKGVNYKYLLTDAKSDNVNVIISFNTQNTKNEWNSLTQDASNQSLNSDTPELTDQETDQVDSEAAIRLHDKTMEQQESSTLHIQKYSLLKYIQKPEEIIAIQSYCQGSIRFTLPKGRNVLRLELAARYVSTIDLMIEKHENDLIQFGTLDKIIPYAANWPFSWEQFGKGLIQNVKNIVDSLGDQVAIKEAIHALARTLGTTENKDLWSRFRCAFYRLASDLLGDSAIPEDLGALRLIFQDCVPSLGPQPYFPQVKTAMNAEDSQESMSVEDLSNHLRGISVKALTAASMIARNWRGASCRKNINALSGQSAGAIRRRTSAKNRMEHLFSKFDDKVHETIVKLLMLESDWPNIQLKSLARDSPHTFSLSSLEGKFPPIHDEWGIIFMESINVKTETELFPFFTEIGTDPIYCRTRIRLIDGNSGKELSTMLRRVNPVKVKPGKYILIGEVESSDETVAGSWKMQLISSPLAQNLIEQREASFVAKTETGFYIPPTPATYEPGLLFRYNITINSETSILSSFHLSCNGPDAKLKLILKRRNEEIFVVGGQGSVLIPACEFEVSQSDSTFGKELSDQKSLARTNSRTSKAAKSSNSADSVASSEYVIEGYCTGGWILSPEEEQWVEKLRSEEENEARVFQDLVGKGSSSSVPDEPTKKSEKKKSSSKVNSPDTQSEQATWLLKIFAEQDHSDLIDLKLDTSRKESVRAMKLAWESAEPGRHLKGHQARIAYLNSFEESGDPIPTVDQLMQKAKKGSLPENPETAIQNFAERRAAVEEYRRLEEEERKNDLVNTQKEYEELNERENRILDQINFSLQMSPKPPSESR